MTILPIKKKLYSESNISVSLVLLLYTFKLVERISIAIVTNGFCIEISCNLIRIRR